MTVALKRMPQISNSLEQSSRINTPAAQTQSTIQSSFNRLETSSSEYDLHILLLWRSEPHARVIVDESEVVDGRLVIFRDVVEGEMRASLTVDADFGWGDLAPL